MIDSHGITTEHGAAALPFSAEELHQFEADDIQAGRMIVALLAGIFIIGLFLYSTVAIIVALPDRVV
jgi:hypothetical protein